MKRPSWAMVWGVLALLTAPPAAALLLPTAASAQPIPRRGDYLPQDVLAHGPVADFAALHLRKPPSGYGWYQIGHTYVMAAVATGLIVEVVAL